MSWEFFSEHEAAVVREATARIVPGPADDPSEVGHPGAREVEVVRFVDLLLADDRTGAPREFAESRLDGRPPRFLPLTSAQQAGREQRIHRLRRAYQDGVSRLDEAAPRGSFLDASVRQRDQILARPELADFWSLLATHSIEGMYGHPVYGGNAGGLCWQDIGYSPPGSSSRPSGQTPELPSEMLMLVLESLTSVVESMVDPDVFDD